MCGCTGNCSLARAPIRPNSAWKALGEALDRVAQIAAIRKRGRALPRLGGPRRRMAPDDLQRDRGKADCSEISRRYRTKLGMIFQSKQLGKVRPLPLPKELAARGQRSAPEPGGMCTSTTLRSFCFRSKGLCPNSNFFLQHRNRASTGEVVALRS